MALIEFAGPPGAGKTTLGVHLLTLLQRDNIKVVGEKEIEAAYIAGSFSVSDPDPLLYSFLKSLYYIKSLFLTLYRCIRFCGYIPLSRSKFLPCYWMTKDMFISCHASTYLHNATQNTQYLTTEGLVQHASSILSFVGGGCGEYLNYWLTKKVKEDLIVLNLCIPRDEGFSRFIERGVPETWPDVTQEAELKKLYSTYYEAVAEVVGVCKTHGVTVFDIDVSGSPDISMSNLECIYGRLRDMLRV